MINKMMKRIAIHIVCVVAGFSASAQDYIKHEFMLRGATGVNSLLFDTQGVTNKVNVGGNVGVGYSFFFNSNWGIGTGLELGFYSSEATIDRLYAEYGAFDNSTREEFTFRYKGENFEEQQSVTMLTIPLLATFQKGTEYIFYSTAGVRISIPVSATYDQKVSKLTTVGYYPSLGYPVEGVPEAGFVEIPGYNSSGDIDLKTSFMLSVEAGMKWKIRKCWHLYTGVYVDYGLNNIQKESDKETVQYRTEQPDKLGSNSLLNTSLTESIHVISCGIRVGVVFGKVSK